MSLVNTETGEITTETLEDLEEIIGRGLETFIEVGDALARVRDSGLYRQRAETFEAYCSDSWGLSRSRAYRLIEAAEVAGLMSPIGDIPAPANEAQARELAPLKDDPEAMAGAMFAATETAEAEGRKVTAADIKTAVAEQIEPEREPVTPHPAPSPAPVRGETAARPGPTPQDVWDEIEDNDAEIQRQVRLAKAAKVIARISAARAELDHIHPDDFTADQLRYLTGLAADLPRFVGRVKSQRTPHLRSVD